MCQGCSWEEINMQNSSLGGLNYGWNIKEGKHVHTETTQQIAIIDPILEYPSNANYARTLTKINQSIDNPKLVSYEQEISAIVTRVLNI